MKINTSSISFKIIVPIMVILTIVGITLITVPAQSVKKHWRANSVDVVSCDLNIVMDKIQEEVDYTASIADSVVQLYSSITDETSELNEDIWDLLCQQAFDALDAESIAVFDLQNNLVSNPEYNTIPNASGKLKDGLEGRTNSGVVLSPDEDLLAYAVQPITKNGHVIAAIEVCTSLTTDEFMTFFPYTVGCEFSILHNDVFVATTVENYQETKLDSSIYSIIKTGEQWSGDVKYNDEDYIGIFWRYPGINDLYLCTAESTEAMNVATKEITAEIDILEIVANVTILILLIVLFIAFILKPLKRTKKAIDGLSSGEADLTYRLPVHGKGEIALLCSGVNQFMELLQSMMIELKKESEKINSVVEELTQTSQDTASATTEIMANIESVKNQAKNQANAVSNTTAIISESNNSMTKLKDNIVAQTSDITESSAAIEQMIGNISSVSTSTNKMLESFSQLTESINEGSKNVAACSDIIRQIEEKSKSLGEANNTISSISQQTNLLAMNAMIESAHAGEAGKGFAVVADEIRKLAENSGEQAHNIESNIQDIVQLIDEGGKLSNLSQESFKTINNQVSIVDPLVNQINGAMDEQTSGSSQILESLSNMKDESLTVDENSKMLDSGIQNINEDMSSVSEISNTILGSMDEMAAGSQQISRGTLQVSDLATQTKDAMNAINEMINKFKV